ncbi:MAG: preprotein translocase subunit SecY [Candidatus Dasytiphilus stammeri]
MNNSKQKILDFISAKSSFSELKNRLFFLLIALVIFRLGCFIAIPGINTALLTTLIKQQHGTIIEMFNMFSGGALNRASIFALGIMPYISSSIIIQLLTVIHTGLAELKKEGESGKRQINQYIRYGTLILAIFQSCAIATALQNMPGIKNLILNPGIVFYLTTIISLVTGTMFLMWLGEQITQFGIGNGISIIIYTGIVTGLPSAIMKSIQEVKIGNLHLSLLMIVIILVLSVIFLVSFIERGQRLIIVNYATRLNDRRMNTAIQQYSTHLPLKVNMAGVIPAIFASSILLFPATLASWFSSKNGGWLQMISFNLQPGQPIYIILYTIAIIFFCFFYTALVFNPRETADNLKKSGAFIPGIRPGEQTAKYIDKVMTRLTFIGAIYITFICLIPEFMRGILNMPFHFGGTSLLIVVVVIMDFMSQIQTILLSKQYESILKKAKIKNYYH